MKKVVIFFVVLISVFSLFAESKNSLNVKFVPYSLQICTTSEDMEPIVSTYGTGEEFFYKRNLTGDLYAEVGAGWNSYIMPEEKPGFKDIIYFCGLGYRFEITSKKMIISIHGDIAADSLYYNDKFAENITVLAGTDLILDIDDFTSFTVGIDGTVGFANKDNTNYRTYRVIPTIGVLVNF